MKPFLPILQLVVCVAMAVSVKAQQDPPVAPGNQPSAPAIQTITPAPGPAAPTSTPTTTTTTTTVRTTGSLDSNDPFLQPPPLPVGKPSLIGGVVSKIDRVRNDVVVRPFGGNNMKIYFDERTHIYRDGVETTQMGIRKGDRVYLDTLLDGSRVFAKNIRVENQGHAADARGQLLSYDRRDGRISVRDELTSQAVDFSVNTDTVIRRGPHGGSVADLLPGSLVNVRFAPESAGKGIAREITIYAAPGSTFTFSGKVTHLDMKSGIIAMQNQSDSRNYEIHFAPRAKDYSDLGVGSDINVVAMFDGAKYVADSVTVNQAKK